MIRINEIKLPIDHTPDELKLAAAKMIKVRAEDIREISVFKRSIDSRKKNENIYFVYTIDVSVDGNEAKILKRCDSRRVGESEFY